MAMPDCSCVNHLGWAALDAFTVEVAKAASPSPVVS